jgi:hypothetical protein
MVVGGFSGLLVMSRPAGAAWLLLGVVTGIALLTPPRSVGNAVGLRRFLTPEVRLDARIAQQFRMDARNLVGIRIRAVAIGPVGGNFRLTLRDQDDQSITRSADVPAAALVREEEYLFAFEPIRDSVDRMYEFDIAPSAAAPGRGIALVATKGERLDEGGLRINDRPRWASLAFQTQTSGRSLFRGLMTSEPGRPPRWLALVGLVGAWLCLGLLLRSNVGPGRAVGQHL